MPGARLGAKGVYQLIAVVVPAVMAVARRVIVEVVEVTFVLVVVLEVVIGKSRSKSRTRSTGGGGSSSRVVFDVAGPRWFYV